MSVYSPSPNFVLRSQRVVTPHSTGSAAVHVRDGIIASVTDYDNIEDELFVVDTGSSVVMPGLVDTHVHMNDPGRSLWEGVDSGTRAAAAGGVTTVLDMPLNSIPATTTLRARNAKANAAFGKCRVDVGLIGGVVPGNTGELEALYDAGVFAFKCFLVPSGVDEFPCVSEDDLREAMPELARLGAVLMVHAELPQPIEAALARLDASADSRRYATYLATRPPEAEIEAIAMVVALAREFSTHVHIVHLSAADAVPLIERAREDGVPVSAESCPHYLRFGAEDVPDGATDYKCAPPIRSHRNRDALWDAVERGVIEMIVSDHSPCPPEMKLPNSGDFLGAWGGIASLQLGLSVVWTEARRRGYTVRDVARWMSRRPARLAGLSRRKGAIAPGYDADFVVWDPDSQFTVRAAELQHRHKTTPYAGARLHGIVEETWLRGKKIYDHGEFARDPAGRLLRRE